MNYRRVFLIILYIGIVGWLSIYVFARYLFFIAYFIIPYPVLISIPYASLLFAVVMFFMSNKWFSAERLLSLLLLLPILLITVIPYISEQVNLYKKPTDSLIRSYFHSFEISQPKVLDLSGPLITYNR